MANEEKREKVIFAIENCLATDGVKECRKAECPFISCRESCLEWILRSALALLKAQEPRVMRFLEIAPFDGVVYLEDVDSIDVIRAICNGCIVTSDLLSFSTKRGAPIYSIEDYNKRWRAWTAHPTDEQRKAVKWDG